MQPVFVRSVLVFASLVAAPAVAAAQGEPAAPRTVAVDGAVVLPLGDYADVADLAFGPMVRVEVPLRPQLAITGRAGALYHVLNGDADGSLWFIPIYGGVRYALGADGDGLYLAGELGITIAHASVDTGFGTASDSDSKLGGALTVGFRRGAIDLRGGLFVPDLGHADDAGLMGSAGFTFARF